MRHEAQSFLRDELACDAADTVGLVFNSHKGSFQTLDELVLPLCKLACLFFGEGACTFLKHLEIGRASCRERV